MRRAQNGMFETTQRDTIGQARTIYAFEDSARELAGRRSQRAALFGFDIEDDVVSFAQRQNLIESRNIGRQLPNPAIHWIVRDDKFPIGCEHDIQLHRVRPARDRMPERSDAVLIVRGEGAAVTHHADGVAPRKPVGFRRFG